MWVNEGEEGLQVHVWVNNEGPGRRVNMRVNEGGEDLYTCM